MPETASQSPSTTRSDHPLGAAAALVLVAAMYAVGVAVAAPMASPILRGWIFNPDADPWWRLSSVYVVIDLVWMRAGILLTLTCAVALARRRSWARSVAWCVAAIGIALRSTATGGHLLLWLVWDRRSMSTYMRLELALTGAIVVTCASVIYQLRGRPSGVELNEAPPAGLA